MPALPPALLHKMILALLPAASHAHVLRAMASSRTPERLIADLLQSAWLTPFQADRLLRGEWASLFVTARYAVQKPVGQGGMGTVYRAWDRKLQRPVALKFVQMPTGPSQAKWQQLTKRFIREAELHGRTGFHPNLVCLY